MATNRDSPLFATLRYGKIGVSRLVRAEINSSSKDVKKCQKVIDQDIGSLIYSYVYVEIGCSQF